MTESWMHEQAAESMETINRLVRAAMEKATQIERERCARLVQEYLVTKHQEAVCWHDVQDCLAAIRAGTPLPPQS